jgi:hypothetical protein
MKGQLTLGKVKENLHISNNNGSFISYVDVFFALSLPKLLPDLTVYRIDLM